LETRRGASSARDASAAAPATGPASRLTRARAARSGGAVRASKSCSSRRYGPVVARIFEETPVFSPLRVAPGEGGEEVRFAASDGVELAGTYFTTRAGARLGTVVFCHEYLGDRWGFLAYADGLHAAGFDLFSFDFRNHGDSAAD